MSSPANGGAARSVLIVDDDLPLAALIREHLVNWGFEVEFEPDGAQALKRIVARDFTFILCDMVMPNFAGDLFYLAVFRVRPALCRRFLFMSGHRDNPKIDAFIKYVDGTILTKPFSAEVLKKALDHLEKSPKNTCIGQTALATLLGG